MKDVFSLAPSSIGPPKQWLGRCTACAPAGPNRWTDTLSLCHQSPVDGQYIKRTQHIDRHRVWMLTGPVWQNAPVNLMTSGGQEWIDPWILKKIIFIGDRSDVVFSVINFSLFWSQNTKKSHFTLRCPFRINWPRRSRFWSKFGPSDLAKIMVNAVTHATSWDTNLQCGLFAPRSSFKEQRSLTDSRHQTCGMMALIRRKYGLQIQPIFWAFKRSPGVREYYFYGTVQVIRQRCTILGYSAPPQHTRCATWGVKLIGLMDVGHLMVFEVSLNIKCLWLYILLITWQLKQTSTRKFVAWVHNGNDHDMNLLNDANSCSGTKVTPVLM